MKKKVYIETSIVSFLTGNPSLNLVAAAWKTLTIAWWEKRRIIRSILISKGYNCPEICTPQELMGGELNEE